MNESDLPAALLELSPFEEALRAWYQAHGRLMTRDEFILQMGDLAPLISQSAEGPLAAIDAGAAIGTADMRFDDAEGVAHLRFGATQQAAILIQRQCRYAPVMVSEADAAIISYAYRGEASLLIRQGPKEESVALHAGDFLLVPPPFHGAHRIERDDCVIIAFAIPRKTLLAILRDAFPEGVVSTYYQTLLGGDAEGEALLVPSGDDPFVRTLVHRVVLESLDVRGDALQGAQLVRLAMTLLLAYIQKEYGGRAPLFRAGRYVHSIPQMHEYLRRHVGDFSLQAMANEFSFSRAYLSRYYKRYAGVTIRESLRDLRMGAAEQLLRGSALPIESVALKVGYADTSYFIETFRHARGMTPLQYRKAGS